MIQSKYEATHPERARMANAISRHCGAISVHTDADVIRKLASVDLNVMGDFMLLLHRIGTIRSHSAGYEKFMIWAIGNEALWMDVWKNWSDLERYKQESK